MLLTQQRTFLSATCIGHGNDVCVLKRSTSEKNKNKYLTCYYGAFVIFDIICPCAPLSDLVKGWVRIVNHFVIGNNLLLS